MRLSPAVICCRDFFRRWDKFPIYNFKKYEVLIAGTKVQFLIVVITPLDKTAEGG